MAVDVDVETFIARPVAGGAVSASAPSNAPRGDVNIESAASA